MWNEQKFTLSAVFLTDSIFKKTQHLMHPPHTGECRQFYRLQKKKGQPMHFFSSAFQSCHLMSNFAYVCMCVYFFPQNSIIPGFKRFRREIPKAQTFSQS